MLVFIKKLKFDAEMIQLTVTQKKCVGGVLRENGFEFSTCINITL